MNIPTNNHAPVKSENRIEIEAPVVTVWRILTDISNWGHWQKAVTESTIVGESKEGIPFHWKAGGISFKSKIHTSAPFSEFGWTGITFGASAIHNWTFGEKGEKTIVIVEESLQGLLPKLFRKYFQKNLDEGIKTSLIELKKAAELKE